MALNCRRSGSNSNISSALKPRKPTQSVHGSASRWKWMKVLFLSGLLAVFTGFPWLLPSVNKGGLRKEANHTVLGEDNSQILVKYYNATEEEVHTLTSLFIERDQITSLVCHREPECESPSSNAVTCVLEGIGSESLIFEDWNDSGIENVGFDAQCPGRVEDTPKCFRQPSIGDKFAAASISWFSFLSILFNHCCCEQRNKSEVRQSQDDATVHCHSIFLLSEKIGLWVIVGMAACYMLRLHGIFWRRWKRKIQQPTAQQPQQFQKQQAQSSFRNAGKWREKLLVVFVISGFITSIWSFWFLHNDIILRRKETLASMCGERARVLQDQFNVSMNHVHALAILVSTFYHGKQPSAIDQKTFEEYTERTAFERPLTSGVSYALRVLHSEREIVEQQQGWTIKKMETEDQTLAQDSSPENFNSSPAQDEYAPVIFSQKTVSHIVSIDMMSGKEDRENILRARASGKGVLTSPLRLLKYNHLGVILTFAVYNTHLPPDASQEQRINATVGYLGASYDVPSLVEKLLQQLASKRTIVVSVYDVTNKSAPIKMYGTDEADMGLLHISNLDFGDPARKHEMHCRFKHKPPPPWQAIAAFVGVLVITLLLGHIFHAAINRIAKVERDCREMELLKHRAEAADVAKSLFLATVSHEIRTPMNGVLGMLQLLMDTNLDANQLDYAQTAHTSGRDLISLINKVLDQAKIESGRLELETVPFDLRDDLDKVLSPFSGKSHRGIELAVYVSDQVPEIVIGDPGRFRQIITNLIGNSVKFTHDKGHIFVSVHLADEVRVPFDVRDEVLRESLATAVSNASHSTLSGVRVVDRWKSWEHFVKLNDTPVENGKIKLLVTVEDTGDGIPLDAQGRIFTPFMQADSSTSRKYGGTGIGLSISNSLVDLMGGEIGFMSEVNTGSTFSFTVVFTKAETNSLDKKLLQHDTSFTEFQGLRALVIDESRTRAAVTRYHLGRLGISVDMTFSLESAHLFISDYAMISGSKHILVVLIEKDFWDKDSSLPLHNLLRELKQNGPNNDSGIHLKILLVATFISSIERGELRTDNLVDSVITKPLRLSLLVSSLEEAIGFRKIRHNMRAKPLMLESLLKGKQILVVDDNAVNRRVAEGALKKYGAIVTCVKSGKDAVEFLKPPHKFDACFMDLQMPGMDGFEATRQIRSLESKYNKNIDFNEISIDMSANVCHWHTPILAMTADVIQATNDKCMKSGMDDYVAKPFEDGQLYSAVARFFESE